MQVDQTVAERLEHGERARRTINKLPAGTFDRERAFEQKLTVRARLRPLLFQPSIELLRVSQFERRLHRASIRPGTDK